MQNYQNDLQMLGMDNYHVGELVPMDLQSQDSRVFGMRCGGCGMRCGGMMCGGMRCGGCGGFRCGGCGGFRCGGCGGCFGFSCFGIGFSCFGVGFSCFGIGFI